MNIFRTSRGISIRNLSPRQKVLVEFLSSSSLRVRKARTNQCGMLILEPTKTLFPAVGKVEINGVVYESSGALPKMIVCDRQTGRLKATGGLPTTHNVGDTLVILGLSPLTQYEVKYPKPYKETYTANSVGRIDIDPSKSNPFSNDTIIKVDKYEVKIANLSKSQNLYLLLQVVWQSLAVNLGYSRQAKPLMGLIHLMVPV